MRQISFEKTPNFFTFNDPWCLSCSATTSRSRATWAWWPRPPTVTAPPSWPQGSPPSCWEPQLPWQSLYVSRDPMCKAVVLLECTNVVWQNTIKLEKLEEKINFHNVSSPPYFIGAGRKTRCKLKFFCVMNKCLRYTRGQKHKKLAHKKLMMLFPYASFFEEAWL